MPGLFKRARCNLDGGDSSIPPQGAQCSWKPNTLLAASPKPQQLLFLSPLFADSFSRQDLPLSDCTSEASDSDCSSGDSENSSQTSTSSCTSIVVPAAESKVTKRVRFSEGPLEDSLRHAGGHPIEGLKRRLRHLPGAVAPVKIGKLCRDEVLEVEEVLPVEEYKPSIDRLKRRAGMLPPLKRKAKKSLQPKPKTDCAEEVADQAANESLPDNAAAAEAASKAAAAAAAAAARSRTCGKSSRRLKRELKRARESAGSASPGVLVVPFSEAAPVPETPPPPHFEDAEEDSPMGDSPMRGSPMGDDEMGASTALALLLGQFY